MVAPSARCSTSGLTSFNVTDHMVNGAFTYKTAFSNMPALWSLSYAWDMLRRSASSAVISAVDWLAGCTACLSRKPPGYFQLVLLCR